MQGRSSPSLALVFLFDSNQEEDRPRVLLAGFLLGGLLFRSLLFGDLLLSHLHTARAIPNRFLVNQTNGC